MLTVFIALSLATLGSVKTPTWEDISIGSISPRSVRHLACFHIFKIHSNLCSNAIPEPQVRCSNLNDSDDGDACHPNGLYSLSRKMYLKGILLLDCVNWGSKVPQLVYGLKLACWMHRRSAAMTRTCRVLGSINETQD